MGGSQRLERQSHSASAVSAASGRDGVAARVRKENPKDAAKRHRAREKTYEGDSE